MPDPQPPISDADVQAAQTIQSRIQHEQEAAQAHRHEIQAEIQGKLYEVTQEVTAHPLQIHEVHPDHSHDLHPMDGYIRGFAEPDHDHPTLMSHHDEPVAPVQHADLVADPGHDVA